VSGLRVGLVVSQGRRPSGKDGKEKRRNLVRWKDKNGMILLGYTVYGNTVLNTQALLWL
jgi:hypothetical protein